MLYMFKNAKDKNLLLKYIFLQILKLIKFLFNRRHHLSVPAF